MKKMLFAAAIIGLAACSKSKRDCWTCETVQGPETGKKETFCQDGGISPIEIQDYIDQRTPANAQSPWIICKQGK